MTREPEARRRGPAARGALLPEARGAAAEVQPPEARSGLTDFPPDVVNGFEGGEVVFKLGGQSMLFAAEGFLLTFSLPNFYFYTVTAYDILRFKGAPIGKRDFLGPLKLKG